MKKKNLFETISNKVTRAAGRPATFTAAALLIVLWLCSGPFLQFSDTWQLIINTSTTIITFLMVFIIQQSQNKDTMAMQLKLNELISSIKPASNKLIDIEDLTEEEILTLKQFYIKLADLAQRENKVSESHSSDSAAKKHYKKHSKSFKKRPTARNNKTNNRTVQQDK